MWSAVKKGLYFLFLCAITFAIAYVLLMWVNHTKGEAALEHLRIPLLVFRIMLCVALIGFWPQLVNYFSARPGLEWPPERTAYMRQLRWKMAAILALVEIIVMQNALGRLLALF